MGPSSGFSSVTAQGLWLPGQEAQLIIKGPLLVSFPDGSCEFVSQRDFVGQEGDGGGEGARPWFGRSQTFLSSYNICL